MLKNVKAVIAGLTVVLLTATGCDRINNWRPVQDLPVVLYRSPTAMKQPAWLAVGHRTPQLFFLEADSSGGCFTLRRLVKGQSQAVPGLDLPWPVDAFSITALENESVLLALAVHLPGNAGAALFLSRSYDLGQSFEPLQRLRLPGGPQLAAPGQIALGNQGTLLLPMMAADSSGRYRPLLVQSGDGGAHWTVQPAFGNDSEFSMPRLFHDAERGLHGLFRHSGNGLLYIVDYDQADASWSVPRCIGIAGSEAVALTLADRTRLYWMHRESQGLGEAISFDRGRIWNQARILLAPIDAGGFSVTGDRSRLQLAFTRDKGRELMQVEQKLGGIQRIQGMTAKSQHGLTEVRWNRVKSALFYQIYQKNGASTWQLVSTGTATRYHTVAPDSGETQSFSVAGIQTLGEVRPAAVIATSDTVVVTGGERP